MFFSPHHQLRKWSEWSTVNQELSCHSQLAVCFFAREYLCWLNKSQYSWGVCVITLQLIIEGLCNCDVANVLHATEPLLTLGFKMHFSDLDTSAQPRHMTVHSVYHASPRCPSDHLCSDIVHLYVTSAFEGPHVRFSLDWKASLSLQPTSLRLYFLKRWLSPKQPRPAFLTYSPVSSSSGM